eukprot:TRINITY_DN66845_c5_g4_i1.p2 TRINITY_DN66845_c5_g4~~TRINITY_DN66845_c5_g4_i1.p2  ORF type:complete len:150 (+),score=2.83 TRINITY_DN66845_c5_g4_i1:56-505(+)
MGAVFQKPIQCTLSASSMGRLQDVNKGTGPGGIREYEGQWAFKTGVPNCLQKHSTIDRAAFTSTFKEINAAVQTHHAESYVDPSKDRKGTVRWTEAVATDLNNKFYLKLQEICPAGWTVTPFEAHRRAHGGENEVNTEYRIRQQWKKGK